MAMARARASRPRTRRCCRCGNEDDLDPIRGQLYCLPCRTCPHDFRYEGYWDPGCPRCVRDLHTFLTIDGPRIRNLKWYVQDALRWNVRWDDVLTWCFDEQDALDAYKVPPVEPFTRWYLDRPPHFDLAR